MSKVFRATLSTKSLRKMAAEIRQYKTWMHERLQMLCNRLADVGLETVAMVLAEIPADDLGSSSGGTMVEPVYSSESDSLIGSAIHLRGTQVAFIEFSAGARYGVDSYPLDSGAPYGKGTYPGKGHWNDPNGWWYKDPGNPKANEAGYVHTYGIRAYMPMYNAEMAIIFEVANIAKDVFGG